MSETAANYVIADRADPNHPKEKLVAAGCRLIAAKGFEPVTVEQVLTEAGISRRTFYRYFASKYELAACIVDAALATGTELLSATLNNKPERAVADIIDCYLEMWARHANALTIISALNSKVARLAQSNHRRFGTALKTKLSQAEQAGCLRNNDALLSFNVITKTAVPLLKVYANHPQREILYRESMLALLGKAGES